MQCGHETVSALHEDLTISDNASSSVVLAALRDLLHSPLKLPLIRAPRPWAGEDEVQEQEAEQDRRVPAVGGGEEASRRVDHPVGHRHHAGGDEGGGPREQADGDQHAGDDLDDAAHPEERQEGRRVVGGRDADQLLGAVLQEQEPGDEPRDAQHPRCDPARKCHGPVPLRPVENALWLQGLAKTRPVRNAESAASAAGAGSPRAFRSRLVPAQAGTQVPSRL